MSSLTENEKFESWLNCVSWYAVCFFKFKEPVILSPEHWKAYYDEGLKPKQALEEDFKNA